MNMRLIAFGLIGGAILGFLRVSKGGGKTTQTPPMYGG